MTIQATTDHGEFERALQSFVGSDGARRDAVGRFHGRLEEPEAQRAVLAAALGEDSLPAAERPIAPLWRRYARTQANFARGRIPAPEPVRAASPRAADLGAVRLRRLGEGLRLSLVCTRLGGFVSLRHGGVARQLAPDRAPGQKSGSAPVEMRTSYDGERMVMRDDAERYYALRPPSSLWPAPGHDDPEWRGPLEPEPIDAQAVDGLMGRRPAPPTSRVRMLVGDDPGITLEAPPLGSEGDTAFYALVEQGPDAAPSPLLFAPVAGAQTWRRLSMAPTTSGLWWWQPPHAPVRCSGPAGPALPVREGGAVDFAHTTLLSPAPSASRDWPIDEGDDAVLVREGMHPETVALWAREHHRQGANPPSLGLARPPRRMASSHDRRHLVVLDDRGEVASWRLSSWPAARRALPREAGAPVPQRLALSPDGQSLALAFAPRSGRPPETEFWSLDGDVPVRRGPQAPNRGWSLAGWLVRPPSLTDFTFTDCGTRLLAVSDGRAAWLWDLARE